MLFLLLALPASAYAQDLADNEAFIRMVVRWNAILDFPETLLSDPEISAQEFEPLRENVVLVSDLALNERKQAMGELERARRLLAALGAPPGEKEPPEAEDIAEKRELFERQVALFDARVKQCNVIITRSKNILKRIGELEISLISEILGKQSQSPLSPAVISKGVQLLPGRLETLGHSFTTWWNNTRMLEGMSRIISALAALVVGLAVIVFVRMWLVSRHGMHADQEAPTLARRFVAILVEALARVVLPVVVILIVAFILLSDSHLPRELETNLKILVYSAIQLVIVTGLAKASLVPDMPQWRITNFTDESAIRLERSIWLLAVSIFILNTLMLLVHTVRSDVGQVRILDFETSTEPAILVATVGLIIGTALTLNVLRSANWRFYDKADDGSVTEKAAPLKARLLFSVAKTVIVAGLVLYLVGYLNLGLYMAGKTIVTLCLIAIALIIHGLVREGLRHATSADNPVGRWVRTHLGLQDSAAERWAFWIVLLIDAVLVVGLFLILLNLWGIPWSELRPFFTALVYGTEIGGHTFSLVNVGLALGVFALLMVAIKLFQGFLSNRILVQTRLDVGVRDAVTAGVGYAGVVIAVLVALSLIGLKFGEIALIFSALSIGIGFGMQHVVNNFISGLILLVQRPIKAGDWIVVGLNQGYVKRINVISTEITTFDNATVIIPNSTLMTTDVMNWTHRGRLGRVKVPVGVSYDSDPAQVKEILLQCAEENQDVLNRPAPNVAFMAFGDSSLDFELRVYIRDIDWTLVVASDLRFAVKKALDEAGIQIPFPQRDVHVKTADGSQGMPGSQSIPAGAGPASPETT